MKIICVCAHHDKRLIIAQGRSLYYYSCPNRFIENREQGDVYCNNSLSPKTLRLIKEEVEMLQEDNKLYVGYNDYVMQHKCNSLQKKGKTEMKVYLEIKEITPDCIIVAVSKKEFF